jgi:hypothetical protein
MGKLVFIVIIWCLFGHNECHWFLALLILVAYALISKYRPEWKHDSW